MRVNIVRAAAEAEASSLNTEKKGTQSQQAFNSGNIRVKGKTVKCYSGQDLMTSNSIEYRGISTPHLYSWRILAFKTGSLL